MLQFLVDNVFKLLSIVLSQQLGVKNISVMEPVVFVLFLIDPNVHQLIVHGVIGIHGAFVLLVVETELKLEPVLLTEQLLILGQTVLEVLKAIKLVTKDVVLLIVWLELGVHGLKPTVPCVTLVGNLEHERSRPLQPVMEQLVLISLIQACLVFQPLLSTVLVPTPPDLVDVPLMAYRVIEPLLLLLMLPQFVMVLNVPGQMPKPGLKLVHLLFKLCVPSPVSKTTQNGRPAIVSIQLNGELIMFCRHQRMVEPPVILQIELFSHNLVHPAQHKTVLILVQNV
jgi:hypothetical protein